MRVNAIGNRRPAWKLPAIVFLLWAVIPSGCCEILPVPCRQDLERLRTDVVYNRSGGLAGTDDQITISTDGMLRITGRLLMNTTRAVTAEEANQLLELLQDWDTFDVDQEPDSCADAFYYSIAYDGRNVSWNDCAPSVPQQLEVLSEFLLSL